MFEIVNEIIKIVASENLFNEGVELIGSWCFQLYQKHLGARSFPLRTVDIDFLIPNPFLGKEHPQVIKRLEDRGFQHDFKSDGSLYLWNADLKIEFITPEKGKGSNRAIKIRKLGINAIPLRFVALLLDNPIIVNDEGIDILLPNPTHFCLHKLIIASRRRKIDKSLKDLQQAMCTSVIVDRKEIKKLFDSLPRKWRQSILRMVDKSKEVLPLLIEDINQLELTLREDNRQKM